MPGPADVTDRHLPEVRRRRTTGRMAAAGVVAAIAALWAYVLFLALVNGRQDPPDTLNDPAFTVAAEARCRAALDEVAALPPASATRSTTERADVVDEATDAFEAMVDDLAAIAPGGEDGELVTLWLADWRTYLEDRREHAEALRAGDDRRFRVSARGGEHITSYLDSFASANDMPACATPLDV